MSDVPLFSSKKCPSCQQWSSWQQDPEDRCEHCGNVLDPRAFKRARAEDHPEKKAFQPFKLNLKPEDGVGIRFFKRIAYGGQLLFAAIVSLIVWIAVAVAA